MPLVNIWASVIQPTLWAKPSYVPGAVCAGVLQSMATPHCLPFPAREQATGNPERHLPGSPAEGTEQPEVMVVSRRG